MTKRDHAGRMLLGVKLLHTAIWAVFASAIVAIPVATATDHFHLALGLSGLVLVEVAILATNRMRCPLSALAGRYTEATAANFDIFLPVGLARNNKLVFGLIFVAGELWLGYRMLLHTSSRAAARPHARLPARAGIAAKPICAAKPTSPSGEDSVSAHCPTV